MKLSLQGIDHAAKALYEDEARVNFPDGRFTPWDQVRPVTRENYQRRAETVIQAHQEWLRSRPGGDR